MEQLQDILATYHQAINVISLIAHHLHQKHGSENHEIVQAPEVSHILCIVYVGQRNQYAQNKYDRNGIDKSLSNVLVAHGRLDFQLNVLTHFASFFQKGIVFGSICFCLFHLRQFLPNVRELHFSVDEYQ
jgi:hypothetical protein